MNSKWTEYELGELLPYEQPTPYIVKSTDYNDAYKTPVLTAGKSFILGYTNESEGVFDKLPVIIFDDFTTATQYVNFKFKVKSSAMKILHINSELVTPKYIFYRMQTIQFDHSTHKRYWIQQYSKIKIPVPPLPEQERIVARIEELFSELDKAVETLKNTKQQLAVYRQAVLKVALSGHFTNNRSILLHNLGEYIDTPRYGTSKKCNYVKTKTAKAVIRIPNIDSKKGIIDYGDLKFAEFNESELDPLSLQEGDILIIRSNGSTSIVGTAAIIRACDTNNIFAGYLMRLRIKDKSTLLPKYLLLYLSSLDARLYIEQTAKSTSGVNNINAQEVAKLPIPVVDIEKQQRIITEIESHLSVCDQIETTIEQSLQQAEAMQQSILKQAFEGKLI